jgi:glycosyltransferase involved in cell wall biosynthesis
VSIRTLILPRYSPQAASGRHRFLQYLPYLRRNGFDCDVSPFWDERYTAAVLGRGGKQWWRAGASSIRRVGAVMNAARHDLVVVHAEFIPFVPFAAERWLARLAAPYIVDFDDAFFEKYDEHRSAIVRRLLGGKLGRLMAGAALNSAGSDHLADYARRFSDRVQVVPTVVDMSRFPKAPPPRTVRPFTIGWIGSPATTPYLQGIAEELAAFARGRQVEIVAIGATPFDAAGAPIRWVPWSEETEVAELSKVDVGIMPLPSTRWAAGKCGFKLIQAMACWKPVVASPVGVNCRIVGDANSGLLAADGEWGAALARLYESPDWANTLGVAGRRMVEREYSLEVWAPRVAALWAQAAGR